MIRNIALRKIECGLCPLVKQTSGIFLTYKQFTVICVDEIIGTRIKIITIESKGDKR